MRAFTITGPRAAAVAEVSPPVARADEVIVDVARAGVCGTDHEIFTGDMDYLKSGIAVYPMRIGHEWCGTVSAVGVDVDPEWMGRRVTGDTMLGCGHCRRCLTGRQHVCADRFEIGILGGGPGALADQLPVPVRALHGLPDSVDDAAGAMVEPGGNAYRAVAAAGLGTGDQLLVAGAGTIGMLVALFGRARGAVVTLIDPSERAQVFAKSFGFDAVPAVEGLPPTPWDAIVDASTSHDMSHLAVDLVEPGKRLVFIGLATTPSLIDTRALVLKDVTATGILSASPGLAGAIEAYATGAVDPRPLIGGTVPLERAADVLEGWRPDDASGPKIHIELGQRLSD